MKREIINFGNISLIKIHSSFQCFNQFLGLNKNLNERMSKLNNPSNEHPVSSAQIPNVPPKLAILSVVVVLTSNFVNSILELL